MSNQYIILFIISMLFIVFSAGCSSSFEVVNTPGNQSLYVPVDSPTKVQGLGIEPQDIESVTDRMVRDILSNEDIANRSIPPLIIVDDQEFENGSSSRIDLKLFTNKLLVGLHRSADNRMYFVDREHIDIVQKERHLKREGIVTTGTIELTPAPAGADYRLVGYIGDRIAFSNSSGKTDWYHQVTFKLENLETNIIIWSYTYDIRKVGADDVVYR